MRRKRERRQPRGVVDTSVLVAGISAFRREPPNPDNKSARLIRAWVKRGTFTWLVSDEILEEYRDLLRRVRVRRATIGRVLNLLGEAAEVVASGPVDCRRTPTTNLSAHAPRMATRTSSSR